MLLYFVDFDDCVQEAAKFVLEEGREAVVYCRERRVPGRQFDDEWTWRCEDGKEVPQYWSNAGLVVPTGWRRVMVLTPE